jgi:hypothetical protein
MAVRLALDTNRYTDLCRDDVSVVQTIDCAILCSCQHNDSAGRQVSLNSPPGPDAKMLEQVLFQRIWPVAVTVSYLAKTGH